MTVSHLLLLGLAALGALACVRGARIWTRCCAAVGWAGMALAMLGGLPGLILGGGVMALVTPLMVRPGIPAWLNAHRVVGMLCMIAVLVGLYALNGAGFCGEGALPLWSPGDAVPLPIELAAASAVQGALVLLVVFVVLSLLALTRAARCSCLRSTAEILPNTIAIVGMALV